MATGRDFDPATGLAPADVLHLDEAGARGLAARLGGPPFEVRAVEEKPYRRRPYPPFMTSTLQQEAGRKFRWSSAVTMRVAQRLYENGFITYMRTDSTTLSETALTAARAQARELYGDAYVPAEPRIYTRKVKNAQEAHEAIRPAGDTFRTPGQVASQLSSEEFRLYELIWQRTLASQMADAVGTTVSVRSAGTSVADERVEFATSGRTITFPGFLRAYVEDTDESAEKDDAEKRLPQLARRQALTPRGFRADGHSTSPPARYTEPSLVKAMEELGIGRPSTYASIMQTIQDRGYVWKKGAALVPSWIAFAVVGLLESYFARLVDYGFTASVENDLDAIANGDDVADRLAAPVLLRCRRRGVRPAAHLGAGRAEAADRRAAGGDRRPRRELDPARRRDAVVRVGRYGPYLQRDEERASIPEDLAPDELTPEKVEELLSAPSGDRALGIDDDGREITAKAGRYGPYVTDGEKTASLFKTMSLDTVTLAEAQRLLTLPRVLGVLDGEEVTAQNGRYGPYVRKGTDSRSLDTEEQLFTVTLDEAAALFAQPKPRGRRAAAPPLRELGDDPVSGKPMVVKDGRFGPYVTDGETNASLRRGDSVEEITTSGPPSCSPTGAPAVRRRRRPARPPRRRRPREEGPGEEGSPEEGAGRQGLTSPITTFVLHRRFAETGRVCRRGRPDRPPAAAGRTRPRSQPRPPATDLRARVAGRCREPTPAPGRHRPAHGYTWSPRRQGRGRTRSAVMHTPPVTAPHPGATPRSRRMATTGRWRSRRAAGNATVNRDCPALARPSRLLQAGPPPMSEAAPHGQVPTEGRRC